MSTVEEKLVFSGSIASFTPNDTEFNFDETHQKSVEQVIKDEGNFDSNDIDNIKNHKNRIIKGWVSRNVIDRVNDRVAPEAFTTSLKSYMKYPILRLNHEKGKSVGKILTAKIVPDKGLFVTAQIDRGYDLADEVWLKVLQGSLRGFSIYGRILKKNFEQGYDGKTIKHIVDFDLQEIAIVDIPANQDSLFEIVKKSVDDVNMSKTEESATEKQVDTTHPDSQAPQEEVGNELISSENLVMKEFKAMKSMIQQQTEAMLSLVESQRSISKSLAELSAIQKSAAQTGDDDFSDDDFEDEDEEDFDKTAEKSIGGDEMTTEDWENIVKTFEQVEEQSKSISDLNEELENLRSQVKVYKSGEIPPEEENSSKGETADVNSEEDDAIEKSLQDALDADEKPTAGEKQKSRIDMVYANLFG